uniref:Uncharacterized protein n=1 Tax=Oryza sativa subsp. japonica TaxID=39947 RepID=Q6YVW7_ORYSJ|nr:hypothetical protein [Oryza sativa Japonica Group]
MATARGGEVRAAATATARGERSWQWRRRRRGAGRLRGGAGGSGDDLAAGTTWWRRWQRRGGRVPCGGDGDLAAATATARGERSWRRQRQRRGGRGPSGGGGDGVGRSDFGEEPAVAGTTATATWEILAAWRLGFRGSRDLENFGSPRSLYIGADHRMRAA